MPTATPHLATLGRTKRPSLSDGAVECLKWFAVLLMTGDHVNKYLFAGALPLLFEAGRIAMPIFAIVLGFNLSRAKVDAGARVRMMRRLAVFGCIAFAPYAVLGSKVGAVAGSWWPLNILFTMLAVVVIVHALEQRSAAGNLVAALVFVLGGALVEFWWPALMLGIAAWLFFGSDRLSWLGLLAGALALGGLGAINGNQWAWAAIPIVYGASLVRFTNPLPRVRLFFYAFYPAHLAVLWLAHLSAA